MNECKILNYGNITHFVEPKNIIKFYNIKGATV